MCAKMPENPISQAGSTKSGDRGKAGNLSTGINGDKQGDKKGLWTAFFTLGLNFGHG